MILNKIEVEIFDTIELIDAYNKKFPDNFTNKNVIYCVHNKINGKNYIGQTIKFTDRFSTSYIGHFKDYIKFINGELSDRRILYRAWKKYGLESFVVYIIDICSDRESLNEKETYWIKTLHTCTKDPECHGYNLSWGADDMGVKDPEAIKRSLATRLEKYGEYLPHCHTKEAFAKGNETKIQRYGHGGFINAFTPEANEKRKQTNLEKYGTEYGPRMSEEGLKRMLSKKIEKYGDIMGSCNTPENRKKAVKNIKITHAFRNIDKYISRTQEILNWDEYCDLVISSVRTLRDAERHIETIIKFFDYIKKDSRYVNKIKTIFSDLEFQTKENALKKFHLKEFEWKSKSHERRSLSAKKINNYKRSLVTLINKINKTLDLNTSLIDWNTYKEFILKSSNNITKGKDYLNKLIDNLSDFKKLDSWTPRLETIFGNLTEKDKLKKRGEI